MKRHLSFVAALGMYFFASTAAYTQQVKLDTGGIAIGGSVSSSTISNGQSPKRNWTSSGRLRASARSDFPVGHFTAHKPAHR